ncbi:TAFII28-domain-containing protein [Lactarius akahatsu]|uniref:Transcription initiation factor TFIID subunit 11 n=1 Tax=Lactarius akahatsu TaxID=416441 RepID=A0AAD4LD90_9AGAM|nr:TAFII28-domain-containing protein [Lactarius akahatsu]
MASPFAQDRTFIPANPSNPGASATPRGRGRGAGSTAAKRGRKPRAGARDSPLPTTPDVASPSTAAPSATSSPATATPIQWTQPVATTPTVPAVPAPVTPAAGRPAAGVQRPIGAMEEEAEVEDELLPAMADDDYSAQLSWQSQSKDNLKVLMDNFTPEQYERFEAYRRHALPKQAVRKVIQQSLGQQVSMPVAQIVAGFTKVFVGEIVEKARAVQARRGEKGPLSPDHLREAYRMYQQETGRVGASRPLRGKRLFKR